MNLLQLIVKYEARPSGDATNPEDRAKQREERPYRFVDLSVVKLKDHAFLKSKR